MAFPSVFVWPASSIQVSVSPGWGLGLALSPLWELRPGTQVQELEERASSSASAPLGRGSYLPGRSQLLQEGRPAGGSDESVGSAGSRDRRTSSHPQGRVHPEAPSEDTCRTGGTLDSSGMPCCQPVCRSPALSHCSFSFTTSAASRAPEPHSFSPQHRESLRGAQGSRGHRGPGSGEGSSSLLVRGTEADRSSGSL